jgi:signal transduction histidine kinase
MTTNLKILIVEDNPSDVDLLHHQLNKSGLIYTSKVVQTAEAFERGLHLFAPDIILSDYSLPSFDANTAFRIRQKITPSTPFIIVSGIIGDENAVELIKQGVTDYASKDKLVSLPQKIARALKDSKERAEKIIIAQKIKEQAAELVISNRQLILQNDEKQKQAAELIDANQKLEYQFREKEQRAVELVAINKELAFQAEENERRTTELMIANKELLAFNYISSHDLQEPLRKIQLFASIILEEKQSLSERAKYNFERIQSSANRMQQLIEDLLSFSSINATERKFELCDLKPMIHAVTEELDDTIVEKKATIEVLTLCKVNIIAFQFRQLIHNLLGNALKFSNPVIPPHIIIKSREAKGSEFNKEKPCVLKERLSPGKVYCHLSIIDNGIGFEPGFSENLFDLFKKFHSKEIYAGTGIGLAIVKKIVENHNGIIIATSVLNKGATFDIYLPG